MTKVIAAGQEEHQKILYDVIEEDGVTYKYAACTGLEDDLITLSDGTTLAYDVAIVCTGLKSAHYYPDPQTEPVKEDRLAHIRELHEQVEAANTIIISGGGPVGVESAADIKLRYPQKK